MLESPRDNDVKIILGKYRHDVKHSANHKALKSFLNSQLEKCGNLLKIQVRTQDDDRNSSTPTKTR